MANVILVVGESGKGKSSAMGKLNPEETFVIKAVQKDLPFKGSRKLYSKDKKNTFTTSDYSTINKIITQVDKNTKVKTLIIDDSTYLYRDEYMATVNETGLTS